MRAGNSLGDAQQIEKYSQGASGCDFYSTNTDVGDLRAESGAEAEAQPFPAAEVLVFETRQ